MKKIFLLSLLTFINVTFSFAQNVAINADATLPNSSAMLDVKSANKGLLIPRVTLTGTADATTIPSPATSLMVYNTAAAGTGNTAVVAGYYYWNGTAWIMIITSTTPSTAKTLIPFASGGTVNLGTSPASPSQIGFGNSGLVNIAGGTIFLSNGPDFAFVVPSSCIITDISGFFSTGSSFSNSNYTSIICRLYISQVFNSNNFIPLSGPLTLFPSYAPGPTPAGTTTSGFQSGLNIPVLAGSRILMVVSAENPFTATITGYFSGGINMIVQ